jgi:two-component system, chemotaxis family, sensor kinase CheA
MIEDKELRDLFKAESEEHLQHLDEGLLSLEKHPNAQATLEDVFREVHSLKGSARMLGVSDVEAIAHRFEDILGAAKRGETVLSPETIDWLYRGLDAIRKLVQEAVTGEPSGVQVLSVLAQLSVEGPDAPPKAPTPADVSQLPARSEASSRETEGLSVGADGQLLPMVSPTSDAPVAFGLPAAARVPEPRETREQGESREDVFSQPGGEDGQAQPQRYRIETIRVDPQKLDALMTEAGELTVIKIRIARRLADIEEIVSLWEEWNREVFADHLVRGEVRIEPGRNGGHSLERSDVKSLLAFYERGSERLERLGALLNRFRTVAYEDTARLDYVANELEDGIRTIRLLPLSTMFNLFPRMVRDLAREQSKGVQLVIEGGETTADKRILEEMKDPLMHLIRNAIDHGVETPQERERGGKPPTASIHLRAHQTATSIVIEVSDDGRGLDIETIKRTALRRRIYHEEELAAMTPAQIQSLIFVSGFSTSSLVTDVSGRGIGLDVVRTNVERLKGTIQVESSPGAKCVFRIQLPITLATGRVLIVSVAGNIYALPVEFVQTMCQVSRRAIFSIEGRETIVLDGQPVSVARLADLLELPTSIEDRSAGIEARDPQASKALPCVILALDDERLGLFVDELLDEREVVLKPLSPILKRVRNVSGATILETGDVCMVLNPHDLLKTVRKRAAPLAPERAIEEVERKRIILLVEDSITTRTQEKRILESGGYDVVTAVDGVDALNTLRSRAFDAVVADIQMPNMDGLTLTAKIREDKHYQELPVILVTSLATEEDKRRGIEVGANAYLTKPTFDQKVLLDTLRRLV